jgi:hypothetical protein
MSLETERLTRAEQSVVMMLAQSINETLLVSHPDLKAALLDTMCDYATSAPAKRIVSKTIEVLL